MGTFEMFISYIIDVIVFFSFLKLYGEPRLKSLPTLVLMILMRIILFLIIAPFIHITFIKIVYAVVTGIFTSLIFFKGKIKEHIMSVFFFWITCILTEFVLTVIFVAMDKGNAVTNQLSDARMHMMIIEYLMITFVSHAIAFIRKKNRAKFSMYQMVLLYVSGTILGIEATFVLHYNNIRVIMYGSLLGVVGIVSVIIFVYHMAKMSRLEEEQEQKSELLNIQREQYRQINERYAQTRKFRHDCSNHIQTLKILSDNGNTEKFEGYVEQLYKLLEK